MKDFRKTLLLLVALVFGVAGFSQTIESKFTHTKQIKASGKTTDMAGTMTFVSPDKLTMNYTDPAGDFFIIDGKNVKINMGGKKHNVNAEKVARVRTQTNTLLNCIKGNYEQAAIDNNTDTEIKEEGGNKIVTLTAKKKSPKGYARIVLTYGKADNMLHHMVLEEFGGVVNTYTLSDIVTK